MKPRIFPVLFLIAGLVLGAQAQQPALNSEFVITKVEPAFQASPTYSGVQYDKRGGRSKAWLEVEVTFDWMPRQRDLKYASEVTVTYYLLLNNEALTKERKSTLLTGSVVHTDVPAAAYGGKAMHSVIYLSPRALERYFEGKPPTNPAQALRDVGVTISYGGQVAAEASWKGRGQWWNQFTAAGGALLNKAQTPFAPLQWDYYEAIKAGPAQ